MLWGGEADEPFFKKLAIYMVTYYHVVPMSLYVCFEMLKLALGLRVNLDTQMICPESGLAATARTADLVEEMGQIGFIFSDKTGTLTKNEMVFARCSVNGVDLGNFLPPAAGSDDPPDEGAEIAETLLRPGLV